MHRIWAGIDAGKSHHHCVAIDAEGRKILSRRVANDEPDLLALLTDVLALGGEVTWAVDLADGAAALLITVLLAHGQHLPYIPGRTVNRASAGYRGEGKTDARDAAIIADQARMRRDLNPIRPMDAISVELKLLTARRADLVADRTRTINRPRATLSGIFPALERAPEVTNAGPLVLLTGYQTPAAVRRIGATRLGAWLRARKARGHLAPAQGAIEAAERQHTTVPGELPAAQLVQELAREVIALNEKAAQTDKLIAARFREHELAEVIESVPGIGPLLGAEFLAATSGNLHRPKRYHRGLQRVFYQSALIAIQRHPESKRFYERKRAEGKRHTQAVIALARRRANVLWALIRDKRPYSPTPPAAAPA